MRIDDIFSPAPASQTGSSKSDLSLLFELPAQKAAAVPVTQTPTEKDTKDVVSLDDAILNFFGANEK